MKNNFKFTLLSSLLCIVSLSAHAVSAVEQCPLANDMTVAGQYPYKINNIPEDYEIIDQNILSSGSLKFMSASIWTDIHYESNAVVVRKHGIECTYGVSMYNKKPTAGHFILVKKESENKTYDISFARWEELGHQHISGHEYLYQCGYSWQQEENDCSFQESSSK
jgi:hypothetical protein